MAVVPEMSKALTSSARGRFFSAFQRYIVLTSPTHRHTRTVPRRAMQRSNPVRYSPAPQRRRAFTISATAPARPKSDEPVLYNLFPATLPAGPPPAGSFVIDTAALRKEFLQLQARAHPDRHSGPDKARAEGTSALINEAYKTLQDPLKRAQYLLSLRGIDVAEDERMKVDNPELLMEVLAVRENIEAAQEEGELEGMKRHNDENILRSERILEQAFKDDDIEAAKEEAVKLRYWTNIKESLGDWERGKPIVLVH